ncbi:MAG: DUF4338 domain-containing protein [Planctomycetaceae bacterium]
MRKHWPRTTGVTVRGREFHQKDLVLIRQLIRKNPSWGRTRLSEEVCRIFDWQQENGRPKDRGCRVALLKLESLGYLQLPKKKLDRGGRPPNEVSLGEVVEECISQMPQTLSLELVNTVRQARIWNSLIARHHYLGLATPVGRLIRYIIMGDAQMLGAISFSEAAWSLTCRDEVLNQFGLSGSEIRSATISNNRFLILPSVQVRNLASRVLGLAVKQVLLDWHERFETLPLFIETFVDPKRFEGTCYRAANWLFVGTTKGFAKQGASHRNTKAPKLIFLIGTTVKSRQFLRDQFSSGQKRAA